MRTAIIGRFYELAAWENEPVNTGKKRNKIYFIPLLLKGRYPQGRPFFYFHDFNPQILTTYYTDFTDLSVLIIFNLWHLRYHIRQ